MTYAQCVRITDYRCFDNIIVIEEPIDSCWREQMLFQGPRSLWSPDSLSETY